MSVLHLIEFDMSCAPRARPPAGANKDIGQSHLTKDETKVKAKRSRVHCRLQCRAAAVMYGC